MKSNLELIKQLYTFFATKDLEAIEGLFHAQIEWTQMKGFPNGGQYIGFKEISKSVFEGFSQNWTNWKAEVHEFLDAGDSILAVGQYSGTYNKTGNSMNAAFIHRYSLKNGEITKFEQYTDTALIAQAMK